MTVAPTKLSVPNTRYRNFITLILFVLALYISLVSITVTSLLLDDKTTSKQLENPLQLIDLEIDSTLKFEGSFQKTYENKTHNPIIDKYYTNYLRRMFYDIHSAQIQTYNTCQTMAINDNITYSDKLEYKNELMANFLLFTRKKIMAINTVAEQINRSKIPSDTTNLEPFFKKIKQAGSSDAFTLPSEDYDRRNRGIFWAINWLYKANSLTLCTILGLISFGILGSACATYIREFFDEKITNEVWIHNLTSVFVRGISAAIVVFLSVKGGVGVLTLNQSSSETNPFALYFICLIAAVFSENIWQWVFDKVLGHIKVIDPDTNTTTTAATPKTTPASTKEQEAAKQEDEPKQ